jgi:hypothetical protein
MLTEEKSDPSDRFLLAITFISNERIKSVLNNRIRRNATDNESSIACDTYDKWKPLNNEILVYTTYAYADIELPKAFNCVFEYNNPDNYIVSDFKITQAFFDLGGYWPCRRLDHGHKHFCVLTFEHKVPGMFSRLKELGRGWNNDIDGLGLCDYTCFEQIRQRIKKINALKKLHGSDYWKFENDI